MPEARELVVRQSRPTSLSDPFHDFNAASLKALLDVPDEQMGWGHLQQLLGPFLPAGTYDESVYFLPRALLHLVHHQQDALDLLTSVFWFCSAYADQLEADGYLGVVRQRMRACFDSWAESFRIVHFDAEACAKKGWKRKYFDHVMNSEVVCEGLRDIARFERHRDIAVNVVSSFISNLDRPLAASWFLELARRRTDVYSPPNDSDFEALLSDAGNLRRAAATVLESCVPNETSPTYWNDTFSTLGI
jgi:hypothetical protein